MKYLIFVSTRHLNAENEMKKRFGSHVVRAENRFVYNTESILLFWIALFHYIILQLMIHIFILI